MSILLWNTNGVSFDASEEEMEKCQKTFCDDCGKTFERGFLYLMHTCEKQEEPCQITKK